MLFIACLFVLVGCGDDGGQPPAASSGPTPGETVEQLARAMEAGEGETVAELMPAFKANLGEQFDETIQLIADNAKQNGGIASITIDKEEVDGDSATVNATLTNGNGISSVDQFELIKKDGAWIIDAIAPRGPQPQPEPADEAGTGSAE